MKYSTTSPPLICMQTQSKCYKGTRTMTVRGVLWHSTGANNPNLSRYVQPSDNAPDRARMLEIIGKNQYGNDINHLTNRNMGVNAWIGKLASGEIAAVQAMPWNYAPWGCGAGSRGSCNDGWIQFEICEDALTDRDYAEQTYREACELTAYLCTLYGIDPMGTVRYKGIDVPTILDHSTSCRLELGSNHGDIAHWFPRYGKNLTTIRQDVKTLMTGKTEESPAVLPTLRKGDRDTSRGGDKGTAVSQLQKELIRHGYDLAPYGGADGIFGNGTLQYVLEFQRSHHLTADGIVGPKTWAALDAKPATYTITIRGVAQAEMEAMKTRWPECEVKAE